MSKNDLYWEEEKPQSLLDVHRQINEKLLIKVEVLDFVDLNFVESSQIVISDMAESSKPCEVGEANKLARIQNYDVWKIKMEAILKRER